MAKKARTAKPVMNDDLVEEVARQFTILSEPARLTLLRELMSGEESVGRLVERTGLKQGTVSKHLGILASAGFVERERQGSFVIYRIADPAVFQLCDLMCSRISKSAKERAAKLA